MDADARRRLGRDLVCRGRDLVRQGCRRGPNLVRRGRPRPHRPRTLLRPRSFLPRRHLVRRGRRLGLGRDLVRVRRGHRLGRALVRRGLCVGGGTVGNVPVNRVSTDRNDSKNGYAKNTVLDDVGIRVKMEL